MTTPARIPALALVALATGLTLGCADSTGGPITRPASELTNLRFAAGAPTLCNDSAGGWVYKDSTRELQFALTFPEDSNCLGDTEDFVRLQLKGTSLLKHPDGTTIVSGDSVFVYVKWVGGDSVTVELQPSGLQFTPTGNPPMLKIDYTISGPDLNDDGVVDSTDDVIEQELAVWRQEQPGDDFIKLNGAKVVIDDEIEVKLNGFSRFAIAY